MSTRIAQNVSKLFLIALLILSSCSGDSNKQFNLAMIKSSIAEAQRMPDSTINYPCGSKNRNIYLLPATSFMVKGNILLLHGWNLSPLGWCEQTTLCDKLRSSGFNIVIPDMGKSMYASEIYPETMSTLADQPLRQWLSEDVISYLNDSLNIMLSGHNNYLIGLSTGARGAFAIGIDRPEIFKGAIVLSGDYDQTLMQDDRLMIYYYGDYQEFPTRWEGKDNLLRQAENWTLPIYIGHAVEDMVVPYEQSDTLYKTLEALGKVYIQSNFPLDYGHDYRYWESESENIINFIKEVEEKELSASSPQL